MLAETGLSAYFADHVVLPLISIIWSCNMATAGRYPVGALLAFLDNHGMLMVGEATRWRTVTGGSAVYVERVASRLTEVLRGTPVRAVRRMPDGVEIRDAADRVRHFNRVVIATHPFNALRLLADPTEAEREVLSALAYVSNPAVLHTDARLLPRRAMHHSSWNHHQSACRPDAGEQTVTYYLNRLQNIDSPTAYLVTLSGRKVDPDLVLARMDYEHPLYTPESIAARARLPELNAPVTGYAGAYRAGDSTRTAAVPGWRPPRRSGLAGRKAGSAVPRIHRRAGQRLGHQSGEQGARPALDEAAGTRDVEAANGMQEIDRPGQVAGHLGNRSSSSVQNRRRVAENSATAEPALADSGRQSAHRRDGGRARRVWNAEQGRQPHVEQLVLQGQAAQPGQRRHGSGDDGLRG